MDIGRSFSFPFEDKQWISKLGIGALITMVPILNFIWTGYVVALTRNVMNNAQEPLPNWDDLGKKFTDGLILAVAGVIYSLPMLIVLCLPLSMMIVPAILAENTDMQDIADVVVGTGSLLIFFCVSCAFVVYALGLSIIYPAIFVLFAREGTFASCFKFRTVFDIIGQNTSQFFTAWLVSMGANLGFGFAVGVAQTILNFIPCVGWIVSFVLTIGIVAYISAIVSHLFGQFGRNAFGGQNQPMMVG